LFNAILGWNNTATLGSVLIYVFYWLAVAATLIYLKWSEGRSSFCGLKSKIGKDREARKTDADDTKSHSSMAPPLDSPLDKKISNTTENVREERGPRAVTAYEVRE
jgi:high-affinity iron transporter